MDGVYVTASPSSSSLYGNVGCAIRELIISKFPYNYFKYMNVSTEVAFHNIRRQFGSNTKTEITKRQFPQLIIQPTYQIPDEDDFLQGIPLTKNYMDIQTYANRNYLFEVIQDLKYGWTLKYKLNRDRIEYDVMINVQTLHNQLDIYKAMRNHITWDNPQYCSTALEAVLPKVMIQYISKLCNMDIYTYPEFIPTFLQHLNSLSGYPITYKVRNASATDEFFMYYQHNIVVTFSDLQLDTGNKKGMVDDYYQITFRVTAEFNNPGLFILDGTPEVASSLQAAIIDKTSSTPGFDDTVDDYIPLYSINNLVNRFPQTRDGLTLYGSFIFTTDVTGSKDTVDIGLAIEPEYQKAIKFHVNYGMIDSTICKVFILKNQQELSLDEYTIDWNKMEITYNNPDTSATYRVVLYMNLEVINADLANPRIDGPYDKSALRDNTITYSQSDEIENDNNDTIILDPEDESTNNSEDSNESEEPTKEIIMKYYSSIFDQGSSMKAEKDEPEKKYKWLSTTSDEVIEEKIKFSDSLDPVHIDAINTWSRIIGNAMLYNYASLFAIEDSNNYVLTAGNEAD